jgi:hypothetical protein
MGRRSVYNDDEEEGNNDMSIDTITRLDTSPKNPIGIGNKDV